MSNTITAASAGAPQAGSQDAAPSADQPSRASEAGSSAQASALLTQATNARTGELDTKALSQWVNEARQQDPEAAAQAQTAVETQLIAQGRIGDLSRFNADVRAGATAGQAQPEPPPDSYGVPGMLLEGGRQAAREGGKLVAEGLATTAVGTRTLVENPILSKVWESTQSKWTGKSGFTDPLARVLDKHGLEIADEINPSPAGSIGKNQGVDKALANNTNGALARDAIAQRYQQQFPHAKVLTEASTLGGARRVDVRVDVPAADPRMNQRFDIESKAGRAGSTVHTRIEATNDGLELKANRAARAGGLAMEEAGQALSRSGKVLQTVGRVARPVGVALGALEVGQAYRADGNKIGEHTGRAASGLAGGAAGAWGGAVAGAAIGSAVPVVGTVIGGVVGGIIGGLAGDQAGRGLFDAVKSWF